MKLLIIHLLLLSLVINTQEYETKTEKVQIKSKESDGLQTTQTTLVSRKAKRLLTQGQVQQNPTPCKASNCIKCLANDQISCAQCHSDYYIYKTTTNKNYCKANPTFGVLTVEYEQTTQEVIITFDQAVVILKTNPADLITSLTLTNNGEKGEAAEVAFTKVTQGTSMPSKPYNLDQLIFKADFKGAKINDGVIKMSLTRDLTALRSNKSEVNRLSSPSHEVEKIYYYENKAVESFLEKAKTPIGIFIKITILLSLFLKYHHSHHFLLSLQMLDYLLYYNLRFPTNLYKFLQLFSMSNVFKFVPNPFAMAYDKDCRPFDRRVAAELGSCQLLSNFGHILAIWLIYALLHLIARTALKRNRTPFAGHFKKIFSFQNLIQILNNFQMFFLLVIFINLKKTPEKGTPIAWINYSISGALLLFYMFIMHRIYKYTGYALFEFRVEKDEVSRGVVVQDKLEREHRYEFLKYRFLIDNYRKDYEFQTFYFFYCCLRYPIPAFFMVLAQGFPTVQIGFTFISFFVFEIMVVKDRPYHRKLKNRLEIINLSLYSILNIVFVIISFEPGMDGMIHYQIFGNFGIFLVFVIFMINIGFFVYEMVRTYILRKGSNKKDVIQREIDIDVRRMRRKTLNLRNRANGMNRGKASLEKGKPDKESKNKKKKEESKPNTNKKEHKIHPDDSVDFDILEKAEVPGSHLIIKNLGRKPPGSQSKKKSGSAPSKTSKEADSPDVNLKSSKERNISKFDPKIKKTANEAPGNKTEEDNNIKDKRRSSDKGPGKKDAWDIGSSPLGQKRKPFW